MQIQRINNYNNTPKYSPSFNAKYIRSKEMRDLIDITAGTSDGFRISEALEKTDKYFKKVLLKMSIKNSESTNTQTAIIENLLNGNNVQKSINGKYKIDTELYMLEQIADPRTEMFKKIFGNNSLSKSEVKAERDRLLSKLA